MSASLIDGKAIAQQVRAEVRRPRSASGVDGGGRRPGLATVLVGDDPASAVYVAASGRPRRRPESRAQPPAAGRSPRAEVAELMNESTPTPRQRHLLQLPIPEHRDGMRLTTLIHPAKDVDGLTPVRPGGWPRESPGCDRARRRA